MRIVPLVLAAGESRRMGHPKPLLPVRGETSFLRAILETLETAGLAEAWVVVADPHGDRILAAEPPESLPLTPRIVRNRAPEQGMLGSIHAALAVLGGEEDARALLIWPVDHPLVRASTVELLVARAASCPGAIVLPRQGERRGHPVVFPRERFDDLLRAPLDRGARTVVADHAETVEEVEVDDPGVVANIDRPADYERLLGPLRLPPGDRAH